MSNQLGFAFDVTEDSTNDGVSDTNVSDTHLSDDPGEDPIHHHLDITSAHDSTGVAPPPTVQVTRSKRSRKTVSARYRDGVMHLTIPAWMSRADEQKWIATMQQRFARANRKTDTELMDRARQLGRQHGLPKPASVVWTRDLSSRWGSCTIDTASIRINGKLSSAPSWVVDYVLVHELAHLIHADHSAAFWDVVNRYPKTERAIGFLMGMGLAED
jgi:predicted metal-dependent hydrolase